jgi:glucokinase
MIAAIEIGGTKLQLAAAEATSPGVLTDLSRHSIDRAAGAAGILEQVAEGLQQLGQRHRIEAIGIGFGGPVDVARGRAITSHQVQGWDGFPLADWCAQICPVPVAIGNDCNVAALAEATTGAGRGKRRVLYVTVGTGIGGGLIVDGKIDGQERPAVAEIGHLRPGLHARSPGETVESLASGLGIERQTAEALDAPERWHVTPEVADQLRTWASPGDAFLRVPMIAAAAADDQPLARRILDQATEVLGWALAQATTLMAPERIVVGGGVSLIGPRFFAAVREAWQTYVFPPLRDGCDIVPAELGDEVVLHGAIQLALRHRSIQ